MIKKLLIFLYFLCSFSSISFSEIINSFNVEGNDRVSSNTIINFSELKLGSDISESDLNNSLKKLYDTNFFKDIILEVENNILNIKVVELPVIQEIIIRGIKSQSTIKELKDQISLKDKNPFDENKISKDINTILNIFKQSGYFFVEVDSLISENKNNTVDLIFDINRGDRATISEIRFIGDKVFKDRKLYGVITSEEDKFWKFISNKKFINIERVNLDKRLLEIFYKEKGYYNVAVNDAYTQLIDNKDFILTYNINAGNKYYFGDFQLNLPKNFDENNFLKLKNKFIKLSGEKYNINQIENILEEIEQISSIKNYEFIDANITENIVENKINFIFDLVETENRYVERINILGNNITSEEFIRDNLLVDEGDPFNKILFNKSINNLRSKGLFKSIKTKIVKSENENTLDIINIDVEEKPTGEITAGAGYGTSGSTLSVGIKENNFNGKGITLASNLAINEEAIKGSFYYTHPNFAYSDRSLITSLESTSTDKLKNFGYKSSLNSFSLGTRYQQFNDLFFSPSFSISNEDIETTSTASAAYKKQQGSYFETNFSYGLEYDKRDSRYQPSSGYISSWYQTLPIVSDDYSFYNSYRITKYYEPVEDMVLSTGFLVRSINSLSSENVRVSKRLFIPSSRLRGFESGKVGPKDGADFIGGNYISTMNISSTLPYIFQTTENIDLKIFFDAGNIWGVDYASNLDNDSKIRSSTGIAMELLTPIGPMSFSLAEAITKNPSDVTESFRFQLGTTF